MSEKPEVVVPVGVVVGLSENPWNVIVRCSSEKRPALDTPVYLHPHPEQPERVSVPREPTKEMIAAGATQFGGCRWDSPEGRAAKKCWAKMLAAAQEGK